MMESGFLLPDLESEDGAPFWEGTARHELRVQTCACGHRRFPPRPMCPVCRSLAHTWEPVSGRATIWSYVVPHPPLLPAYSPLAPYNVIVVALDEDPTIRMVGNLLASPEGEINEVDPATIVIGEPVEVVYQVLDDVTVPRWVRTGGASSGGAS